MLATPSDDFAAKKKKLYATSSRSYLILMYPAQDPSLHLRQRLPH